MRDVELVLIETWTVKHLLQTCVLLVYDFPWCTGLLMLFSHKDVK